MKLLRFLLRETEIDGAGLLRWVAATQSIHGAVFTYVESLIVMAALSAAGQASESLVVWALFGVAFAAQALLTVTYVRAAAGWLLHRSSLVGRTREAALWVVGTLAVLFSVWLAGVLGDVIGQLVEAGLAGLAEDPTPTGGNAPAVT